MAAADKAYELTEENFEIDAVREKLSTFRRKRLGMFSQNISGHATCMTMYAFIDRYI